MSKTIFEKTEKNQKAYSLPKNENEFSHFAPPTDCLRKSPLSLPEVSELNLTRHFCDLASKNMSIDTVFYPLGSCTMKFNPRINEWAAALPGFTKTHPLAPSEMVQGNLKIIFELIEMLCDLCGMQAGTLAPNAGAQGEFTGIKMIAQYHLSRQDRERCEFLIPDDAHGTNPASVAMSGFQAIPIKINHEGNLDLEDLKSHLSRKTAGLMLTNPNTLGLFSSNILEITHAVHQAGGLLYYDGANLNALLNIARPGDMGFDVMHLNLHKTFSTPHGGGGPGSGPVLCHEKLKDFLPIPKIEKKENRFEIRNSAHLSIGRISTFFGNFSVFLRAYLYIKLHGKFGLRKISEAAVLNANYLKAKLASLFTLPFKKPCMHEFVIQTDNYPKIRALDIAKRILDFGVHAPTIYFPLIIKESMLIEPTESESKQTLDHFVQIMETIVKEIDEDPSLLFNAPQNLAVSRLNEVEAAKHPILKVTNS